MMKNTTHLVKNWKKHLSEKVDPDSINLSAFKVQDSLNTDVFEDDDFVDADLKKHLEKIARDFIEGLGIPVTIDDIVITGSIANYNWSRFSDVDVHILVDFDEIDENHELVKEMFQKAHAHWNRLHNIKVNDHEVEMYVQDVDEPHTSTGIYSLLNDKWVKKPKRRPFTLNKEEIQAKAAKLMDDIDEIEELLDNDEVEQAFEDAGRLKEKIRNFRKGGLEKGGEYSTENLAFKVLRRNGYLERLSDMKNDSYDQMMSLEEHFDGKIDFDLEPTDYGDRIPQKGERTLGADLRITFPRHKSLERVHGGNFSLSGKDFADEWDSLKSSEERDDDLDRALDNIEKFKSKETTKVGFLQGKPIPKEVTLSETVADLKRVKEKYKDDIAMTAAINRLENNDPSGNHKYINWFVKQLEREGEIGGSSAAMILGMVDAIQKFHRYIHLIDKKDISQYRSYDDLRATGNIAQDDYMRKEKQKETYSQDKEQAQEESNVVFDSGDKGVWVVRPDSEHASCFYGRGAKWCISAEQSQNYFDSYTERGKVFYIVLDKARKNIDPLKKVAWVGNSLGEFEEFFDAKNKPLSKVEAANAIVATHGAEMEEVMESDMTSHLENNLPDHGWEYLIQEIYERYNEGNRYDWVTIEEPILEDTGGGDGDYVEMRAHVTMVFKNPAKTKHEVEEYRGVAGAENSNLKKEIHDILYSAWSGAAPDLEDIRLDVDTMAEHEGLTETLTIDYYFNGFTWDVGGTPEGLEDFYRILEDDVDGNFSEGRVMVKQLLVREGYVEPNEFDQHATGYVEAEMDSRHTDEKYHDVAVTYHPEDYSIIMTIPVDVPREIWDEYEKKVEKKGAWEGGHVYGQNTISLLNEASQRVLEKTLKDMKSAPDQQDLPGLEGEKFIEPQRDMKVSGFVPSSLSIDLQTIDDDRVVQSAYSIAKFIDNNFEEFKKRYIKNIQAYAAEGKDEFPVMGTGATSDIMSAPDDEDQVFEEMADVSNEPYQKMARKRFGKAMRLTVKGPERSLPKGWKVINPVPGKSGPPGE
mgnify:CR=1 FL=1